MIKRYPYNESYPLVMENYSFGFNWCCDCGLRHARFIEIQRGKTPADDVVKEYVARDDHATNYRRDFERLKAKSKGRKGASRKK